MWLVEVRVLNQTDNSTNAVFSNQLSGGGSIISLKYRNNRIGGCGNLTLEAKRERISGHTIANGNLIEVYTHNSAVSSDSLTRRYKGVIRTIKTKYTEDSVNITAWGFWEQFKWQTIVKYMETVDVESVVSDIFDAIKANTYCNSTGNISLASSASIGDIELHFQEASEMIKKLAKIQGNVDYGVDGDGVFYFVDSDTTKRGHFQVGINVFDLEKTERADELYNDLFFRTRKIISSGNLTLHEDDDTSIASYKKRTKILDAPEFSNINDAITWGQKEITTNKNPVAIYTFMPKLSDDMPFPYTGKIELVDEDGISLNQMFIEGIEYIFEPQKGFQQKLYVGERQGEYDPGSLFANIERKVAIIEASNISSRKIDHSGYDEFYQYVGENAYTNGLYNLFTTDFSDYGSGNVKVTAYVRGGRKINRRGTTSSMENTNTTMGAIVPLRQTAEPAIIETVPIPTGRTLDTLRVYYHADLYGRYTFSTKEALEDWYNANCSDSSKGGYLIDSETGSLTGNSDLSSANRGILYLAPRDWVRENIIGLDNTRVYYQQNDNGAIKIRINDIAADNNNDIPFKCVFNYEDLNNYATFYIERISAATMRLHLKTYVGGALNDSDYGDTTFQDILVRLNIRGILDDVTAIITKPDETAIDLLTADIVEQTKKYFYFNTIWNSDTDTGHANVEWFEIPYYTSESDRITIKVTRDDGTNWESYAPPAEASYTSGWSYYDFDLSGQGSGNKEIKIKVEVSWPALLYGIGAAWGGD